MSKEKTSYCWKCAEEFPMSELVEDDNPYLKDEFNPKDKNYQCKPCLAKEDADEGEMGEDILPQMIRWR